MTTPRGTLIIRLCLRFYPSLLLLRLVLLGKGKGAYVCYPCSSRSYVASTSQVLPAQLLTRATLENLVPILNAAAEKLERCSWQTTSTASHHARYLRGLIRLCDAESDKLQRRERPTSSRIPLTHAEEPPVDYPSLDVSSPWRLGGL
jgi:hypothetical protein